LKIFLLEGLFSFSEHLENAMRTVLEMILEKLREIQGPLGLIDPGQ